MVWTGSMTPCGFSILISFLTVLAARVRCTRWWLGRTSNAKGSLLVGEAVAYRNSNCLDEQGILGCFILWSCNTKILQKWLFSLHVQSGTAGTVCRHLFWGGFLPSLRSFCLHVTRLFFQLACGISSLHIQSFHLELKLAVKIISPSVPKMMS